MKNCLALLTVIALTGIVPAATADEKTREKKERDPAKIAYLGVATENVEPAVARHLKLRPGEGLTIVQIDPKSAAAGVLKEDDVLKEIESQWLVNPEQLSSVVRLFKPGESVTLQFIREGDLKKATVKLGEREDPGPAAPRAHRWDVQQDDPWQMMRRWQQMQPPGFRDQPESDDRDVQPRDEDRTGKDAQIDISSSSSVTENGRTATLTNKNGRKHLTVKKDGKTVFDGPVNNDEQIKALEPEIRELYDRCNETGSALKIKTSKPRTGRVDI